MGFLKKKKFHSVVAHITLLSRTALIVLVFVCLRLRYTTTIYHSFFHSNGQPAYQ